MGELTFKNHLINTLSHMQVGEDVAPVSGKEKGSPGDQLKAMLAEYGKVGLLVHLSVQVCTLHPTPYTLHPAP